MILASYQIHHIIAMDLLAFLITHLSQLPYDMPASGRIESLPLVDLAIALGVYSAPAVGASIWSGLTGLGEMGYGALSGPFSTLRS